MNFDHIATLHSHQLWSNLVGLAPFVMGVSSCMVIFDIPIWFSRFDLSGDMQNCLCKAQYKNKFLGYFVNKLGDVLGAWLGDS
jgi:hypothetical protein